MKSMSPEVLLVQEIEKYEYLYNTFLPEYNRKDLTDEAWAQVSRATNLTATECKEKWRNIRSSLLRSLKPSERAKKPYYLKSYLNFVMPFLKPLNSVDYKDDLYNTSNLGSNHKDSDILICTVKSEEDAIICDVLNADVSNDDSQHDPLSQPVSPASYKRKRSDVASNRKRRGNQIAQDEEHDSATAYDTPQTNIESMQYFLMSLLPEFETMTEEQTRMFKIKVMMLIDEIKTNYRMFKQTIPSMSESDRLQKRLINLLLKNLQKKVE